MPKPPLPRDAASIYKQNREAFASTPENIARMSRLMRASPLLDQEPGNTGEYIIEAHKRILALADRKTRLKNMFYNKLEGKD